jgi:hypothetical protein
MVWYRISHYDQTLLDEPLCDVCFSLYMWVTTFMAIMSVPYLYIYGYQRYIVAALQMFVPAWVCKVHELYETYNKPKRSMFVITMDHSWGKHDIPRCTCCMDAASNCRTQPCTHRVMCSPCAAQLVTKNLKQCMLCQGTITKYEEIIQ